MSGSAGSPGAGTAVRRSKPELKQPKQFKVLLHNDHYTTMDFVVEVLRTIFRRSEVEAVRIMLAVHRAGIGVAGVYSAAVAEMKVTQVHERAKEEGFPLRCSIEPE